MSEDAHWSGVDAMALRDLKVCQTCGDIYDGTRCGTCPRLRADARAKAQQMFAAGASEFGFVQHESDGPALMAYRVFLLEELATLQRRRRQSAAIRELRRVQSDAAAQVARWKRLERAAKRVTEGVVIWAAIVAGAGILGLGMWEAGRLLLRVLLGWGV